MLKGEERGKEPQITKFLLSKGREWREGSIKKSLKEQYCISGIKLFYLNLCKDTINDFQEIFF